MKKFIIELFNKITKIYSNEFKYLYLYLLNIIFFSLIYYFVFSNDFKDITNITFIQSFYLSVVTTTTLGYGDIIPNIDASLLQFSIITQVMLGITLIGLFLNSLAQKVSDNKTMNNSILRANEYLKNNASLEENFIVVNKIANLNRLNKEYKQYEYILQDFFIKDQSLKEIRFENSKLYGMKISNTNLHSLSFFNVKSDSSQFLKCTIKNCIFEDCSFDKVNFNESNLININFNATILTRAKFNDLALKNPIITNSNLNNANFENSKIYNANFKNTDFTNVSFKNAVLNNVNFSGAKFNKNEFEGTILNNVFYKGEKVTDISELK
ncbi:pentapeptide repeat-containing protein [Aliarcobacter butzleri]|nr:pentapeptide repeat-containing protein [Aliarcobacter butzleri]